MEIRETKLSSQNELHTHVWMCVCVCAYTHTHTHCLDHNLQNIVRDRMNKRKEEEIKTIKCLLLLFMVKVTGMCWTH